AVPTQVAGERGDRVRLSRVRDRYLVPRVHEQPRQRAAYAAGTDDPNTHVTYRHSPAAPPDDGAFAPNLHGNRPQPGRRRASPRRPRTGLLRPPAPTVPGTPPTPRNQGSRQRVRPAARAGATIVPPGAIVRSDARIADHPPAVRRRSRQTLRDHDCCGCPP